MVLIHFYASPITQKTRRRFLPIPPSLVHFVLLVRDGGIVLTVSNFLQKLSTHWIFCIALLTKSLNESCEVMLDHFSHYAHNNRGTRFARFLL